MHNLIQKKCISICINYYDYITLCRKIDCIVLSLKHAFGANCCYS